MFHSLCCLAHFEVYWSYKTAVFKLSVIKVASSEASTGATALCFQLVHLSVPRCFPFSFPFPSQKSHCLQARFSSLSQFMAHHLLRGVVLIKFLYNFFRSSIRYGPWAPEVPVPAEECQKAGRHQEEQRPWPEDSSKGCFSIHVHGVSGMCLGGITGHKIILWAWYWWPWRWSRSQQMWEADKGASCLPVEWYIKLFSSMIQAVLVLDHLPSHIVSALPKPTTFNSFSELLVHYMYLFILIQFSSIGWSWSCIEVHQTGRCLSYFVCKWGVQNMRNTKTTIESHQLVSDKSWALEVSQR